MTAQLRMAVALFALSSQAVLGEMAAQDVASLRGAPESPRRLIAGGQCCYGQDPCNSGTCNPPVHFCSSEDTCLQPTSQGGCDSSATGGHRAVWCPSDTPLPTVYPEPAPPTKALAPAPPLFTLLSENTGCSNFASLVELARFPGEVSNVFCAQACSVTKGCTFWTYQDEPNDVCEALQPTPAPLQPALGDDACILFAGQCKKEENACWDVLTLSAAKALRLYDDAPESKSGWELDRTSVAVSVSLAFVSALLAAGAVIRVAGSRASSLPASSQEDEQESLRVAVAF